jgi:hypothetical protein
MKTLLKILAVVVVILVLLAAAGWYWIDSLAEEAIETSGTYALGVDTELGSADVSLASGDFDFSELRIANPEGYQTPSFVTAETIHLNFPVSSLLDETIEVPAIELRGIGLVILRNERGTNYGVILDNLARFESGEKPKEEGGKTFVVRRLAMHDISVTAQLLPAGGELTKVSLHIPELIVEDLGAKSTSELISVVIRALLTATLEGGGGVIPADLLQDLGGKLQSVGGAVAVTLTQSVTKTVGELGEAAGEAAQEIGKGIRGVLQGAGKKKQD